MKTYQFVVFQLEAVRCEQLEQREKVAERLPKVSQRNRRPAFADPRDLGQGPFVQVTDDHVEELENLESPGHRIVGSKVEAHSGGG